MSRILAFMSFQFGRCVSILCLKFDNQLKCRPLPIPEVEDCASGVLLRAGGHLLDANPGFCGAAPSCHGPIYLCWVWARGRRAQRLRWRER